MNNKRTISNIFRCNRFYEPMIPGGYLVKFRFKDEIAEQEFEIEPGDCYQTLLELCNGFCEGYGHDGEVRDICRLRTAEDDPHQKGYVLERTEDDALEQGNIYLTPDQVDMVVSAAGNAVYGRRIPMI